ncbi:MAG: sugar transferase [Bryobacteraceae bacterium]
MIPERTHPGAPVAVEESEYIGGTESPDAFRLTPSSEDPSQGEEISAISMSTSLLALSGVFAGGSLAAAPDGRAAEAVHHTSSHPSICLAKRLFDIVFAACALLTFLPILAACAIALKAESAGPLFFRQRRLGTNGVPFEIVKFRTMVADAEAVLSAYLALDPIARREWEANRKLKQDPRITRAGALMRKFSLDEVPQFWNVLKGDMSIVGPRPIVPAEVQYYADGFASYAAVRPGITGLWQVSGRNDVSYPNRVALDCKYVRFWSLRMDLAIIAKTVSTVVRAAGAY